MNPKKIIRNYRATRTLAAGSVAAVAVLALLVPFNMGGCSTDTSAITSGLSGVLGGGSGGSGTSFSGTGNSEIDRGITGAQGLGQAFSASSMGEPEERALGQSVALNLTNRFGIVKDDLLNRYVTMVAQVVADATPTGGQVYVAVLDTDEINAFSGPTGYVLITRGALKQMHDESELAGVLAHEIGHIAERHGLAAVQQAQTNGGLAKIGMAVAGAQNSGLAQFVAGATRTILETNYSQAQESQADADAVRYMAAAGYDPAGFLHYLQRLEQLQTGGTQLFSTHPGIAQRIQAVGSQIDQRKRKGGQFNPERFETIVLKRL